MNNMHPGNNDSAKESNKNLSDLEQFFDNVTINKTIIKYLSTVCPCYTNK